MLAILLSIFGVLKWVGSFIGGKFGKMLFDYATHKEDVALERYKIDATVKTEEIRADVQLAGLRQALLIAYQGWGPTRWIVPCIAYPLIIHMTAVVVYSMFWCRGCIFPQPWSIAALPDPMNQWEGQVILSFFLVRTGEIVAGAFSKPRILDVVRDKIEDIVTGKKPTSNKAVARANYKGRFDK